MSRNGYAPADTSAMGKHSRRRRLTAPRAVAVAAAAGAGMVLPAALPVMAAGASTDANLAPAQLAARVQPAPVNLEPRPVLPAIARAKAQPSQYTVRPGDSLYQIAARLCGAARYWPDIWRATQGIADPNMIFPGKVLTVVCSTSGAPATTASAVSGPPRVSGKVWGVTYGYPNKCGDGDGDGWDISCSSLQAPAPAPAPQYHSYSTASTASSSGNVNPSSFGSYEACVIARESGGNSQVMNSSGHYGLFQFSASTWAAYGGSPGDFGHASAAEQEQVFSNAMAQGGQSNWSPYDGC